MNRGAMAGYGELCSSASIPVPASERDRLILEHVDQVKLIARRIHERLPPQSIYLEDLISAGMLGLISAIDHYDAARQVKLKTYAEYKIKGAVLDCLRELDWVPRQHRRRAREIETAIAALEQVLHRTPSEEEVATHLGLSVPEYQECASEVLRISLTSLDRLRTTEDEGQSVASNSVDEDNRLPFQVAEKAELEHLLAAGIKRIPELERTILHLYYYQEMTLREIAEITGLNQSRISQLKTRAVRRLRSYMHVGATADANKHTQEVSRGG